MLVINRLFFLVMMFFIFHDLISAVSESNENNIFIHLLLEGEESEKPFDELEIEGKRKKFFAELSKIAKPYAGITIDIVKNLIGGEEEQNLIDLYRLFQKKEEDNNELNKKIFEKFGCVLDSESQVAALLRELEASQKRLQEKEEEEKERASPQDRNKATDYAAELESLTKAYMLTRQIRKKENEETEEVIKQWQQILSSH